MSQNDHAAYAKEQVELIANYIRDHWEHTDLSHIQLHTADLLRHVDEALQNQVENPAA